MESPQHHDNSSWQTKPLDTQDMVMESRNSQLFDQPIIVYKLERSYPSTLCSENNVCLICFWRLSVKTKSRVTLRRARSCLTPANNEQGW